MTVLFILASAVAAAASGWLFLHCLVWVYLRYRQRFDTHIAGGMEELFLFPDPGKLWAANLVLCVVAGVVGYVLTQTAWITAAMVFLMLAVPRYGLRYARRRRWARFEKQLPDLLMALAAALRAGAGLQAALSSLVPQSPQPLKQEFSLLLRQQRLGVPLDHGLDGLLLRMPVEGARLVVSALKIATRSGGGLATTLDGMAATLRARLHMQARLQALTSQGRMQAWLMAAMPPVLAMVLHYLDPDAMQRLWATPLGWAALAVIVVLETVGILLVRRIVTIQI